MTFNKTSFWICVKSSLPPKIFSHQMASRSINSRACTHHRYLSVVKKIDKKVYQDLVLSTKKKYYVKSSKFWCHVNVAYLHIPFLLQSGFNVLFGKVSRFYDALFLWREWIQSHFRQCRTKQHCEIRFSKYTFEILTLSTQEQSANATYFISSK